MTRKIEIYVNEDLKEEIDIRDEKFQAAIGYLTLWGIGGPTVKVHISVSRIGFFSDTSELHRQPRTT